MTTKISTRDALLALRQFQQEDFESQELIEDLRQQLNNAEAARASRFAEVQTKLESYVEHQCEVHGFGKTLEFLMVQTEKGPRSVRPRRPATPHTTQNAPTSLANLLDDSIVYSDREFELMELLKDRWPAFTDHNITPTEDSQNQMAATVYRLRRKGVPIESAQAARKGDTFIAEGVSGYRLIL